MSTPPPSNDAPASGPRQAPFSLDDAKNAVLAALQLAVADDVLSEADAHDFAASINSFTDTFALDDWVFVQSLLKRRICNFPLCFNAPRPASRTGGGNPPAYCTSRDQEGHLHSESWRAKRLRKKLREQRDQRATETRSDEPDEPSRPVTAARSTVAASVATIQQGLGKLTEEVRALREAAERSTDETLVQAEIAAIQHRAREDVEREARLRAEAEKAASAADNTVARMKADIEETDAAFEQLEARAAQDRAEREAAQTALADTKRAAADEVAAMLRHAQNEIDEAQAALTAELAHRSQVMADEVAAANDARDAAIADVENRERAAAVEVASATQRAADALAARDEHKTRADTLAEANVELVTLNNSLRDAALHREREYEAATAALRVEHEQVRAQLQSTIDELHARLDQLREEHDTAMTSERRRHEDILAARLREAADNADRLLAAQTASVTLQNELLQARLDATEQGS